MANLGPISLPAEEMDRAFPPRFWWMKRIGVATGAVLLILLGIRGWEVHKAAKELRAEFDAARALGEPTEAAELTTAQGSGSSSPADLLRRAASSMKDLDSLQAGPFPSAPDEESEEGKKVYEQWVQANGTALALARRARDLPNLDWQLRLNSPLFSQNFPDAWHQRTLANVLREAALVSHRHGDDAAAIEFVRDMLALGRAVRSIPTGIGYLSSVGITASAGDALENMPDLAIATVPQSATGKPANPQQVRALMRELAEEETPDDLARAFMHRRVVAMDAVQSSDAGFSFPWQRRSATDRLILWLFKPVTLKHDVRLMMYFDQAIATARQQTNYGAAMANFPARPRSLPIAPSPVEVHLISFSAISFEEKLIGWHFRSLALRRLEEAALADKLYRAEHGSPATTVDELLPYLAHPPRDPFDRGGSLIRMITSPRRLYSVGQNGHDDSAQSDDVVIPLDPPAPSSASQPVDVRGNPEDAQNDHGTQ